MIRHHFCTHLRIFLTHLRKIVTDLRIFLTHLRTRVLRNCIKYNALSMIEKALIDNNRF